MSTNERRNNNRKTHSDFWVKVSILPDHPTTNHKQSPVEQRVKIENLSISGACIISELPFELDQKIQFHDQNIDKTGKVVWTCQSKIECKSGIHFD